jgi:hypothetical protein
LTSYSKQYRMTKFSSRWFRWRTVLLEVSTKPTISLMSMI